MDAHGQTEAAVLVPMFGYPTGLVFTERRHDLRRHAGEILSRRPARPSGRGADGHGAS